MACGAELGHDGAKFPFEAAVRMTEPEVQGQRDRLVKVYSGVKVAEPRGTRGENEVGAMLTR